MAEAHSSASGICLTRIKDAAGRRACNGNVFGSGAAMIPCLMIKKANLDQVRVSTAGTTNFLVVGFSAMLGPDLALAHQRLSSSSSLILQRFHETDLIWVGSIVLVFILTSFLRETGSIARPTPLHRQPRADRRKASDKRREIETGGSHQC
jgi:hypothetical protein